MGPRSLAWLLLAGVAALQTANAASQSQLALQSLHGPFWQCGGIDKCPGNGKGCLDAPWPEAECMDGFECVRENIYYWQCKRKKPVDTWNKPASEAYVAIAGLAVPDAPIAAPAAAASPSAEPQPPAPKQQPAQQKSSRGPHTIDAADWAQCGGVSTCTLGKALCGDRQWANCPAGFVCVKQDEFYRQCKPMGVFPLPDPLQHASNAAQKLAQAQLDARLTQGTDEQPAAVVEPVNDAAAEAQGPAAAIEPVNDAAAEAQEPAVDDVPATVEVIKPVAKAAAGAAAAKPQVLQKLNLALEFPGISEAEFRQSYSANSLSAVSLLVKVPSSRITETLAPLDAAAPTTTTTTPAAARLAAPATADKHEDAATSAAGRRLKQQPAAASAAAGVRVTYLMSTPTPLISLARINKAAADNGDLFYKLLAANDVPLRPGLTVNGKALLPANTPAAGASEGQPIAVVAEAPAQAAAASESVAPVAATAPATSSNVTAAPAKGKHDKPSQPRQAEAVAAAPAAAPATAAFWTRGKIVAVAVGVAGGVLLAALSVLVFVGLRRRAAQRGSELDSDDGLSVAEGSVYSQQSLDRLRQPKYIYYDAGSELHSDIQPHYSHSRTSEVSYPVQPCASFR